MSATQERNPFLPEAPYDGKHAWGEGPADLGGNRRCTLCGAYRGSTEGEALCRGEYRESGKMRAWAANRWIERKLLAGGPARQIVRLTRSEFASVTRCNRGVRFGGSERISILLACGCEREVDHDAWEAIHWGHVTEAGCPGDCPEAAAEANDVLNNRTGERNESDS